MSEDTSYQALGDPAVASKFADIEQDVRDLRTDIGGVKTQIATNHAALLGKLSEMGKPNYQGYSLIVAIVAVIQIGIFFLLREQQSANQQRSDMRYGAVITLMETQAESTKALIEERTRQQAAEDERQQANFLSLFEIVLQNEKNTRYNTGYADAERFHARRNIASNEADSEKAARDAAKALQEVQKILKGSQP